MEKFRLLTADDIECRVKKVTEKGAIVLLYKTARTDMDILDEALGAENWECDYKEIKGNLYCGIGISADGKKVWKWDCGTESREDDEGNQKKGEASDSFKRAGFKWGIGRELYTAPFIFIPANKMNIENRKTFDTFSVSEISYDDKRRISALAIKNNKTKAECFRMGVLDKPSKPVSPPKPAPQRVMDAPQKEPFCTKCGGPITDAERRYSQSKFGRELCRKCQ